MPMHSPNVIAWDRIETGDRECDPGSGDYRWRLLAEGDSWFTLGGLPTSNLLFSLELAASAIVVNCALPGDTIRHMAEIAANRELQAAMSERFGYRWDAILLSGGGNDLIDAVDRIIVAGRGRAPDAWINAAVLTATLDDIVESYGRIVAARDAPASANAGKRIVVHTYDYTTPNNTPATFLGLPAVGPWFWRRFETLGLADAGLRAAITDRVLDRLAETLLGLASRFPAFQAVDTRGTLVRAATGATGNDNDWLNEIHPNSGGYRKIADRICGVL